MTVLFIALVAWGCIATYLGVQSARKAKEYRPKARAYDKMMENMPR